jgi:hypothetical protein
MALQERGSEVCSLNKEQLEAKFPFGGKLNGAFADIDIGDPSARTKATAAQLCFLAAFSFALLHHGHGFDLHRNFTVVDTMEYGGSNLKVCERKICCGWRVSVYDETYPHRE